MLDECAVRAVRKIRRPKIHDGRLLITYSISPGAWPGEQKIRGSSHCWGGGAKGQDNQSGTSIVYCTIISRSLSCLVSLFHCAVTYSIKPALNCVVQFRCKGVPKPVGTDPCQVGDNVRPVRCSTWSWAAFGCFCLCYGSQGCAPFLNEHMKNNGGL